MNISPTSLAPKGARRGTPFTFSSVAHPSELDTTATWPINGENAAEEGESDQLDYANVLT
jgi:hypothetical protein